MKFVRGAITIIGAIILASVAETWGLEQSVELTTASGILHGTIDLPNGACPCPVVAIIAGSGPTDRNGNQPQMKNDSLKLLGQALAARGIAALRYDKRGVAASAAAGPKQDQLRFETYVADLLQWVAWLRKDSRFPSVGLIGHSEGSLIGILAAKQAKIDAFISLAGSGRAASTLIREQLDAKLTPALKTRNGQILDELIAGRRTADVPKELAAIYPPSIQPYLISWFKYDPGREIAALDAPVLILQGTSDLQISVRDAQLLAAAKKGARLRLIDGMNHVLKHATAPAEQQAAYMDASLPIEGQLVEEITVFLNTEMTGQIDRSKPAAKTGGQ